MIGADKAALIREVAEATKEATNMGRPVLIQKELSELTGREETPRERMIRLRLFPTEATLRWARKGTSLGSPGVEEKFTEIWSWAKGNWHWIGIGATLYTVLLIACARRGK